MKFPNTTLAAVLAIFAWSSAVSLGQTAEEIPADEPAPDPTPAPGARITHIEHGGHHAEELIDRDVRNTDGVRLGSVDNVVVDVESNRILYIIVETSQAPGDINNPKKAVPPQAFSVTRADEESLLLNIPWYRWENAPGFHQDELQDAAGEEKVREVYDYFREEWRGGNTVPQAEDVSAALLSDLIGKKVLDMQQREIGHLESLLVNLPTGRLAFAVVSTTWFNVETRFALFPEDVTPSDGFETLIIHIDPEAFEQAEEFALTNWMRPMREGDPRVFRYGEEQAEAWRGAFRRLPEEQLVQENAVQEQPSEEDPRPAAEPAEESDATAPEPEEEANDTEPEPADENEQL